MQGRFGASACRSGSSPVVINLIELDLTSTSEHRATRNGRRAERRTTERNQNNDSDVVAKDDEAEAAKDDEANDDDDNDNDVKNLMIYVAQLFFTTLLLGRRSTKRKLYLCSHTNTHVVVCSNFFFESLAFSISLSVG